MAPASASRLVRRYRHPADRAQSGDPFKPQPMVLPPHFVHPSPPAEQKSGLVDVPTDQAMGQACRMGRVTRRVPVTRFTHACDGSTTLNRAETLAVEEPLELRIDGISTVTTMRTPGHDVDLALGLLLAEGMISHPDQIATAVHCNDVGPDGRPTFNVLDLARRDPSTALDLQHRRTFGITSACGVCGSATIDAIRSRQVLPDLKLDTTIVPLDLMVALPERMRRAQSVFDKTGGLHAAALFRPDGSLVVLREDVGRHNACDKAIGFAARELGWPLPPLLLTLSGRASFELVQKAWVAGIPIVAAVSAASSLAVEVAEAAGLTLAGFLRGPSLVCYTAPHRLQT